MQAITTAPDVLLYQPSVMDRPAVPDQNDRPGQMQQQAAKEPDDLHPADVVGVELDVHPESPSARGNRQGSDGGDTVPAIAVIQERRLAPGSPRAAHRRDQEEPAFVDKYEVGTQPTRFFLI